ncbi:phosphatase PAP2 family protein [Psychrobacillus sp. NPDC058041]|uniref:phosphatase PAP2 family protein n=1 Tax=Psychrobacillus sp. NPDC058041 TaxID=3346310 RepID=UPI0036DD5A1D
MHLDFQLFELINQFAGKNNLLDQTVILFSKYGLILLGLALLWLWFTKTGDKQENRKIVLLAFTIAVIALGIDKLIEITYFRPRPFVNHAVTLLVQKSNLDPSFPSNHSAGSFALAFAIFWKRKKMGTMLLTFAFFMAISRIYLGVHYPLDVMAGAIIALAVTYMVLWQQRLLEPIYKFLSS